MIWRRGHLGRLRPGHERWGDVPGAAHRRAAPGEPGAPSTTGDPVALGTVVDGRGLHLDREARGRAPGAGLAAVGRHLAADGDPRGRRGVAASPPAGRAGSTPPPASRPGCSSIESGRTGGRNCPSRRSATRSAATLVWTGSELLFWGGIGDESPEMDGAIWHCC